MFESRLSSLANKRVWSNSRNTSKGSRSFYDRRTAGNGGQGNVGRLSYLGDAVVIVAPNGYERSWNINNEASKADNVSFLLALITKVTADFPAADSNDVTIIGTSNGAAMIYRLLIETGKDRPFHR